MVLTLGLKIILKSENTNFFLQYLTNKFITRRFGLFFDNCYHKYEKEIERKYGCLDPDLVFALEDLIQYISTRIRKDYYYQWAKNWKYAFNNLFSIVKFYIFIKNKI